MGFHGSFVGWEFEKKDRVGKIETHNEKGGGAAVADAVALVERTGRSEGVQSSQVVQTAPKGPPVIYQPVGAPVVHAAGGQQCAQAAGMSQQSMCAGIPPAGMASQLTWGNGCGSQDGNWGLWLLKEWTHGVLQSG